MISKRLLCGLIFIITIIINGLYDKKNCVFSYLNIVYYLMSCKTRRVTAIGCECGLVKVAIVNAVDLQVSRSWLLRYDKPVPSVIVFPHRNAISKPNFVVANCKYFRTYN